MTEQNQTPPDDHELEQFLARRSELSQRYHSDVGADAVGEGAPPELDAAVLARARAELQRPVASSRRFLRWGRPLALAASLMLVVSLGWMAQQKPLPQEVTSAVAPVVVPKEVAVPAMDAIPAPPAARKTEEVEQHKAPAKAASPTKPQQPGSASAAGALAQRQAAEAQVQADMASPPSPPSEPPPMPTSAPVPVQQAAPMVMVKPVMPEASRDQAYAYKRESRSAIAASSAGVAAEPAPVPVAPAAAIASPTPAPFAAAPSLPQMAAPVLAAPVANSAPASNPCASSPVHGAAPGQVQVMRGPDSAAWLQQIRRLRDASDLDGARAELACFNYLHAPGDVPEDLKPLLPARP